MRPSQVGPGTWVFTCAPAVSLIAPILPTDGVGGGTEALFGACTSWVASIILSLVGEADFSSCCVC